MQLGIRERPEKSAQIPEERRRNKSMSNFHSSISRRDFMKGLGLAGAGGLGAAVLANNNLPVEFKDLDDVLSAGKALEGDHANKVNNDPWWVATRDHENPTCNIDWSQITRYSGWNNQGAYVMPDNYLSSDYSGRRYTIIDSVIAAANGTKPIDTLRMQQGINWMIANIDPNYYAGYQGYGDRKEDALLYAATNGSHNCWVNPLYGSDRYNGSRPYLSLRSMTGTLGMHEFGYNDVKLQDYPKWQGTPEENLILMRAVSRYFGASSVGAIKITDNVKKIFFAKAQPFLFAPWHHLLKTAEYVEYPVPVDNYPIPIVFDDVPADQGHYSYKRFGGDDKIVVPNALDNIFTYTVMLPETRFKYVCSIGMDPCSSIAYPLFTEIEQRLQTFIAGLGYNSMGGGVSAWGPGGAFGNLSGLGEQGRVSSTIEPRYGSGTKGALRMLSDLPLAPTKPIDAGIREFCKTCGICATKCPGQAISYEGPRYDSPFWDCVSGYEGWHLDYSKCIGCTNCESYCPFFTMSNNSWVHGLVKATIASTPTFNGFFKRTEEAFGYGPVYSPNHDQWWAKENPIRGASVDVF
ncbi:1,2-trans-dichloroethene reductive dehalogenase catalytic A subunit TdrA [Dehalogenimonas sp. WBC-2]|nr:1,2-trans-dichloroethene reductive dehalogenase catalytic A subunit TdrA [Dehalogenimonas sp. WBC-2]AKL79682.1 trans-1,2-dichloroethene reductive dehalogenase subunit A [Dehalogenimonas sp. WBC-2]